MAGFIIVGILILLFVFLGIIFLLGKGAFLIAGYNTMSEEEKSQYDEGALTKLMGWAMFGFAISMTFWLLSELFNMISLMVLGFVLFFIVLINLLIKANTKAKVKK